MKCDYCGEELDPKNVAYYLGKRVHPKCFTKMKWKYKYLSHEERVEILKKKVWSKNKGKSNKTKKVLLYPLKSQK